jgi:hypothetical protein
MQSVKNSNQDNDKPKEKLNVTVLQVWGSVVLSVRVFFSARLFLLNRRDLRSSLPSY